MSDFEQDFMAKVSGDGGSEGGVAGGVTPGGSAEKKPLDKRWFVIGGLVLLLIVALIVVAVAGGRSGGDEDEAVGGGNNTDIEDVSLVGTWDCENESRITFSDDGGVTWVYDFAIIEDDYVIDDETAKFGAVSVKLNGGQLIISRASGEEVVCEKEQDE